MSNFYLLAQLLWWIVVQFTLGIVAGLPKDQSWKCHKMVKDEATLYLHLTIKTIVKSWLELV